MTIEQPRTVIIGLDGVPFGLMKRLSDHGVMPNFKELREDGVFRKMASSIPEISSVSWSSIITGKNPGEHGIFGFTDMIPGTYTLSFPNFNNLKSPPFWHLNGHMRHVIINVPFTYPAKPLNGLLISGFVSLDLEGATYPQSYVPLLKELDYRIDVDAAKGHKSKSLLLKELGKVHEIRMKACRYLWKSINWNIFMLVFTGTDRIGHFLFDAYEDLSHEHHKGFLDYFAKIDKAIGEISSNMKPHDNLLMCSDHGMELVQRNVNVNKVLLDNGFLVLGSEPEKNYNNIAKGTKAFALDPGRIYLNRAGSYPNGSVRPEKEGKIIQELTELFSNLKANGKRVVKVAYTKEGAYKGQQLDRAPDIILLPNKGFNLKASIIKGPREDISNALTGKHSQDDAFLFVKNKCNEEIVSANPRVEDISGILSSWVK